MQGERLDRMENLMEQLVKMVASTNQKLQEIAQEMKTMNQRMESMEQKFETKFELMDDTIKSTNQKFEQIDQRFDFMEAKNEERHNEVIKELNIRKIDQDFIWEKVVRNEREIAILKNR